MVYSKCNIMSKPLIFSVVLIHFAVAELFLNASISFKDCFTYVNCSSPLNSSDADCGIRYGTDPSVPELVTTPVNTQFQLPLLKPLTKYHFVFSVSTHSTIRVQVLGEFTNGECMSKISMQVITYMKCLQCRKL